MPSDREKLAREVLAKEWDCPVENLDDRFPADLDCVIRCLLAFSDAERLAQSEASHGVREDRYLIRKGGAYYRKNSQGYTHHREAAGRYRLEEAIAITHPNGSDGPRDGMDYVLDTNPATSPKPASDVSAHQAGVPEGYALVPVEPTLEMLVAGQEEWMCVRAAEDRAGVIWSAMLAASPSGTAGGEDATQTREAEGVALADYDYNELWDAIAKATRIDGGIIAISVRTFRAALSTGGAGQ